MTFADGVSSDSRNYNVSFARIRERLPEFQPRWDVRKGIHELHDSLRTHGLTYEQFAGKDFTRLKQLQHLLDCHEVRTDLTWKRAVRA